MDSSDDYFWLILFMFCFFSIKMLTNCEKRPSHSFSSTCILQCPWSQIDFQIKSVSFNWLKRKLWLLPKRAQFSWHHGTHVGLQHAEGRPPCFLFASTVHRQLKRTTATWTWRQQSKEKRLESGVKMLHFWLFISIYSFSYKHSHWKETPTHSCLDRGMMTSNHTEIL